MSTSTTDLPLKGLPTKRTSKILYRNRSCYKCVKNPCFPGFENMKTDFAMAGCIDYIDIDRK
jgi:hypothetical protein